MTNQNSTSEIVKQHIRLRGKTMNDLSFDLGIKKKTLYDELQHNRISAERLLEISAYLEIDLEWMKTALGYTSQFKRLQPKRMSDDYRKIETPKVIETLKRFSEELNNPSEICGQMLAYFRSLYYLLDVIIEKTAEISVFNSNGREKCFVIRNYGFDIQSFVPEDGKAIFIDFIKEKLKKDKHIKESIFVDQDGINLEIELNEIKKSIADDKSKIEEAIIELGTNYYNNGKYRLSLICFEHAISLSDNPIYHAYKANTLSAIGSVEEAISEYEKALPCDNESIILDLLGLYSETKNYFKAIELVERIENDLNLFWITQDELLAQKLFFLSELNDQRAIIKCCNQIIKSSSDSELIKYAKFKMGSVKH